MNRSSQSGPVEGGRRAFEYLHAPYPFELDVFDGGFTRSIGQGDVLVICPYFAGAKQIAGPNAPDRDPIGGQRTVVHVNPWRHIQYRCDVDLVVALDLNRGEQGDRRGNLSQLGLKVIGFDEHLIEILRFFFQGDHFEFSRPDRYAPWVISLSFEEVFPFFCEPEESILIGAVNRFARCIQHPYTKELQGIFTADHFSRW